MNYNLLFTIYGVVFTILLYITLFVKKRKNTIRTKAYTFLVILSLIYSFSEIFSLGFLIYMPSSYLGVLFKNINNVCMFNLIAFFVNYFNIIYYQLEDKYDSFFKVITKEKRMIFVTVIDVIVSIIYIITSIDKVIILDDLNFISTTFGLSFLGVVSIILILCLVSSYGKKLMNLFKCFLVTFIVFILLLPFQLLYNHISFIPFFVMLILFIIYYFVENPDIELLDEVTKLKMEIDKTSNTKMDFLFNLSYDLITPINTIVSLSKSLSEMETLDKELALNDLHSIKYAGNGLLDSVNNILDMSSGNNDSSNNKEYSVVELIKRLQSVVETKIGAKQVSFEVSVANNVNSKLIGDINKIQKVLLNILNNAVKYTDIGKIKMDVTATNDKGIQILNFTILDTGCGIKEEDKDKIYLDTSDENSGVGLAVSKQFIESMNGSISFKSVYGAGTTFYVSLPQIISGSRLYIDDVDLEYESSSKEIIDSSNYKLAIVDDDNLDIKVTMKLLKKYNFQIEVIDNTIDFINKIK